MVKVLNWNGKDMPPELKDLPAGRYAIEALEHSLTPEEEQGLEDALDDVDRGDTVPHEQVMRDLRAKLGR